jgi:hypothetical protein
MVTSLRFVAFALALTGCIPDLPSEREHSTDGGSSSHGAGDRGAPDAGSGGRAETPSNLLDNPSFERADCASWRWNGATVASVPLAAAGAQSCRVCAARPDISVYGLEQSVPVDQLSPGTTYAASAWLRADDDPDRAVSTDLRVGVTLDSGPHTSPLDGNQLPAGPITTTWKQISKLLTYTPIDGGTHITFDVVNRSADDGCFLIDDVTLTAMP